MSRYDVLTTASLSSKSSSASKPSIVSTFSSKSKDKTSSDEEIRLYMLQRIQPSPITRWNASNVPRYLYHAATRVDWMHYSETYEGVVASPFEKRIDCVDEGRLDALVSRKFFRAQYEEGIGKLNTTSAKAWRTFTSVFGLGSNDAIECVERAYGEKTTRANINTIDEYTVEDTTRVLLVIDTHAFVEDGFIDWTSEHNFPHITRTINKNLDACFDYPLRYCTRNLRLALPSELQLAERAEALNASGKYCENMGAGKYNRIY